MTEDAVDAFIGRVRAVGADTAIIAWQQEWDMTDARGFGPVRRARLLAYAKGEVIAADVGSDQVDRDAITARLTTAGLRVEHRSRNVT